jgi:hypothetical protein
MTPENRFEMPTVCSSLTKHNQTEVESGALNQWMNHAEGVFLDREADAIKQ